MGSSEGRVAALFTAGVSGSAEGSWPLMKLRQRWVWPRLFVVCVEYRRLWNEARSVSENLRVLWVARRLLHVIFKEKRMTGIVLSTLWARLLQWVVRSLRAGLLLMRWHVRICQWRLWQTVMSTHHVCLHVNLLSSFLSSFWFVGIIWWPLIFPKS